MSSFFQKSGSTSTVENTIQTDVDAAAASAAAAEAAQAASETAKAGSETAKTASETAQTLSETARDASITAQLGSQAARDTTLGYRNTAETHKDAAASSASAASASETASQTAQTAAEAAEANAATSEANAASSASSASSSQAAAASSASSAASDAASTAADVVTTNADVVLTNADAASTAADRTAVASDKATVAADKAIVNTDKLAAASSAAAAASSASTASSAQTAAEAARDSALAAYDNFDDRYLGTFTNATEPTVDNDGDALVAGSLYYNSDAGAVKLYNGTAWVAAYISGTGFAALNGATFTGNVTVPNLITSGTVDGRDVATDGTKLDGIATNAIANVVEDTTPQLGGNLDTNGNDITGTGNLNLTGTVTADGLTVDGDATLGGAGDIVLLHTNSNVSPIYFSRSTVTDQALAIGVDDADVFLNSIQDEQYGGFEFQSTFNGTGTQSRLSIANNGDISFYDSTGVSQGLFWDASTQRLGLGSTTPSEKLTVDNGSIRLSDNYAIGWGDNSARIAGNGSSDLLQFYTSNTESMTIDSGGNVGIGTTPSVKLDVYNNLTTSTVVRARNDTTSVYLDANNGYSYLNTFTNHPMLFGTNNTERMRIASNGNVGIGTTSPTTKLDVRGTAGGTAAVIAGADAGGNAEIRVNSGYTSTVPVYAFFFNSNTGIGNPAQDNLSIITAATERMRIDSSGNVGIANSNPSAQLQVGNGADALTGIGTGQICLSGAGQTLAVTGKPAVYHRSSVGLGLYSDYAMSFEVNGSSSKSEAMRIDSSGNVGIGTTSPVTYGLEVSKASGTSGIRCRSGSNLSDFAISGSTLYITNNTATGPTTFFNNAVERMRITSAGNVGIGTSSPSYKLAVDGGSLGGTSGDTLDILQLRSTVTNGSYLNFQNVRTSTGSGWETAGTRIQQITDVTPQGYIQFNGTGNSYGISFGSGSTERMRIDSSGNVLVGTSTAYGQVVSESSGSKFQFASHNTDTSGVSQLSFRFMRNTSDVGSITTTGSGTTYNTTSDIRLKTDIAPIADATDKLMAMNPVSHKWKADPDADAVVGFIAQEMQEIVPEAVSGSADSDEMMSMDYGRITPVLVAALQDAHKKIEQLEQRIADMETK